MWMWEGKEFDEAMIGDHFGFCYCITNLVNGQKYIGKKQFFKYRTKGKLKIYTSSDWKTYFGSCKELLEDVKVYGKDNFHREIISLHTTKRDMTYYEAKLQFNCNVLESVRADGQRTYYNGNILNKFFCRPTTRTISKTFT